MAPVTIAFGMKLGAYCSLVLSLALTWSACGAENESLPSGERGGSSGNGGASGSGGSSGDGSGGTLATGGASGTGAGATGGAGVGGSSAGGSGGDSGSGGGGAGGSGTIDASYPDIVFSYDGGGVTGPPTTDSACATASATASVERAPVDIIIAVDTSGSMGAEAGFVQQNLNSFSTQIINAGIDVHVVLISATSICIAAPLGSGACPNDTRLPTYLHVPQTVGSRDGLQIILNTYSQWQAAMRANAQKHIVIVTDDDSSLGAASFDTQFKALSPSHANYKFHGIFAFTDPFSPFNNPCFALSFAPGNVYKTLVQMTGGVQGDLCLQNFTPVFNAISTSVVQGTPIQCEFPMPTPTTGTVDPSQVSLEFEPAPTSTKQYWNLASGSGSCNDSSFYYDAPTPTKIILCPGACTAAKSASNPTIKVLLGCLGA